MLFRSRDQQNGHRAALEDRRLIHACLRQSLGKALQHVSTECAVRHLTAAETDRGLYLVASGQELGRLVQLGVEVVGVNVEREAGLFDFDHLLVLLGFLLLLLLWSNFAE